MPFPILPVIGALVLAGGGVGAYFALRRRAPAFGGVPSQKKLASQTRVTIEASQTKPKRATPKRATPERMEEPEGWSPPAPRYKIDEANGWEAVWLRKADNATLEWGFCLWDLMEAQTDAGMFDEGRFAKMAAGLIGRAVEWVIAFVKKKTIDISICYRIELPAVRFELMDGRSFWIPSEPEGGLLTDIQGWDPNTTRLGFSASLGKWPLGEPPPGGAAGIWIRPLGDLWDWSQFDQPVEVYQIVAFQGDTLKSIPAMSRRDWRIALMLGGQTPSGGEIYTGGVAKWFKDWRLSGQKYKMRPASRSRAMKFFEK